MYKKKKISVVVPAYNEEVQILKVIDTMPGFVDFIVITDDKSTDRTVKVIQNCQKANPKIDRIIILNPDTNIIVIHVDANNKVCPRSG